MNIKQVILKKLLFSSFLMGMYFLVNAQSGDTVTKEYHLNGSISATNNGISFIPTFSLGKPATIFNFSVGGHNFNVPNINTPNITIPGAG